MARPVVKRDSVLRAALELFVEKGIAATTTRDIAGRAGCAEGTMYRYYPSKEDLAWDLYWTHFLVFVSDLRQCADAHPDTRARLRAMIAEFCRLFDEDPVLYGYLVLAEHWLVNRVPADADTPPKLLLRVLAEGQARGEVVHPHLDEAAALVIGTVIRLTVFRLHGRVSGPLSARVDSLADLCWRAIGQRSATPNASLSHPEGPIAQ